MELDDLTDRVLTVCEQIPPGMVCSYGDFGAAVGCGPRQVGKIMRTHGFLVPWWRVVRADGTTAVADRAMEFWDQEGTPHCGGRVDMSACRFSPVQETPID